MSLSKYGFSIQRFQRFAIFEDYALEQKRSVQKKRFFSKRAQSKLFASVIKQMSPSYNRSINKTRCMTLAYAKESHAKVSGFLLKWEHHADL